MRNPRIFPLRIFPAIWYTVIDMGGVCVGGGGGGGKVSTKWAFQLVGIKKMPGNGSLPGQLGLVLSAFL